MAAVRVPPSACMLVAAGTLKTSPLREMVAATSVGIVDASVLLDLC
jgi:ribonuclease PH